MTTKPTPHQDRPAGRSFINQEGIDRHPHAPPKGVLIAMTFFEKMGFIETAEQERERLAQSPEGSLNHELSKLPVTFEEWPQGLIIELPWKGTRRGFGHRVVVVPIEFRGDPHTKSEDEPLPRKRHSGWWTCVVVASNHPSYPVGGNRLSIPAAELARGTKIELFTDEPTNHR